MLKSALLVVCLLSGILFAAAADAADTAERGDVTLYMDFYYGDIKIADVTESLRFVGDEYELNSMATAVGLAKVLHGDVISASRGKVDEQNGLLMTMYSAQRGRSAPKAAVLTGDILRLKRGEETREEIVSAPVFDYLSAVYRSYILGAPTGGTLWLTNGWRLREYIYTVEEEEIIETGMGEMRAVPLSRTSERGERKIWLAPELNYLPVRLYIDDKGHIFQTIINRADLPAN